MNSAIIDNDWSLLRHSDRKGYHAAYFKNSVREDGRSFLQSRKISIQRGVFSDNRDVYGSSQVQVGGTIVTWYTLHL